MKRLLFLIGVLAALSASSQISRIEYFWDADPGFGNAIALPITPGDSVSAVFTCSTIGLQPGMHTLYIRSQDASGRWSVFGKKAINIQEPVYSIAAAEYFFDTDPGFGNGTPINITIGDSILLTDTVSTGTLAPGLHTLYVRVRDNDGKWSVFSKRSLHILQPTYHITEAEYFVDTDPGFGNGTSIPITPGDSIDTTAAINTTSLLPGVHTVYFRAKTSNGEWSVYCKRPIIIDYPISSPIVAAEYFVDTDPGIGNAIPITVTPGDSVLGTFQVATGSLSLGIHMVYARVKYGNDQWSVFSKKLIYIDNPADDSIVAAEFFVDTDPGFGNATPINVTPNDTLLANFQVPTNGLLVGTHNLYVRVKDQEERWSVYSQDTFFVGNFDCDIFGNGEIELIGDTCRGTQITFKDKTTSNSGVNSSDFTREWDFFDNDTIDFTPDSIVNYTFDQTGTYTLKLTVYETANPVCQEVIYRTFTIRRTDSTSSNVSICDGDSVFAGGTYQTTTGIYYDTHSNRYGCDSVHVTNLTVDTNVTPSVTISVDDNNVCSGVSTVFTATPVSGGSPLFTWKVNGLTVGSGYANQGYNPFGISTLANGDTVTCEMTSSETCTTVNPAISNNLIMNVTQSVSASITIAVDTNNFCSGTTATFTITDVVNEGSNPLYDWYMDNALIQSGGDTFVTSTLLNGHFVRCFLTSDAACITTATVVSNRIDMTVFSNGFPTVSIGANTNSVCYGTLVTFTASSSYEGSNPNYEWFLNGSAVQSSSSNIYSNDSLDDADEVSCVLTSDYQCRLAGTDTSNTVTMSIIYSLPVGVTLTPNGNNICEGTGVTFTANPTNAGSPTYEFFINGNSVQSGSQFQYSTSELNNNDSVWVVVTSDISCATNNPATSDTVYMSVVQYDTVSVSITVTDDTICEATNVVFTATAVNPGAVPTYLWRVNNIQVQSSASDTFSSSSLSDGSIVKCELYGDHQCVTPVPAVSNSISMSVIDTILPSVLVSIPQTTVCQGTQVDFTATLFNEGNNPTIEWLLNNNVIQTGGLIYGSDTLKDFDAIRVRLTTDYECPVQNPVLSNNVVMTVIDSVTPSVFAYHGPNPACPGSLISVFTTTSTGGDAPTYEFRVNGSLVLSGPQSQYTSSNFNNGDIVQVTMNSNAECIRQTTVLSNPDTIVILSFVPADVSIQITSIGACTGDSVVFEATPVNGGTNPIYTWRVNNVVFQSGGSNIFASTALQNGDSVYCEMNSGLSCATNNPAKSQTITVQFPGCCVNDEDCDDSNQCTDDVCDNSNCTHNAVTCDDGNDCTMNDCNAQTGCIFTPVNCDDGNQCTDDYCDSIAGQCVHDTIPGCGGDPCDTLVCADNNICTFDTCLFGACLFPFTDCGDANACTLDSCNSITGCFNTPFICNDSNLCTDDTCHSQTGCAFTPINCNDGDPCTDDYCDDFSGSCIHDTIPGCGNPCDTLTCFDNNLCTTDGCDSLSGCFFTPVSCNDNDVCTTNSCDSLLGCIFSPISCDDSDSCTIDGCNPLSGCFHLADPSCFYDCTVLNCDDGNACTTDDCDSLSGCFYNPVICNDNNMCTSDGCDQVVGCTFTPVNCNDGEPCTDDYCDTLSGLCIHDTILGCGNPCDTLTCFDNNLCTSDTCTNGSCVFNPISCNDGDACTTDSCDAQSGCFYTTLICDDSNLCTSDNCNTQTGCVFNPVVCNDNDLCTSDGCAPLSGCTFSAITCDDNNLCTSDECNSATGCFFTAITCNDNNLCTSDRCDSLTGCTFSTIICNDSSLCTTDGCDIATGCTFTPINCNDSEPCTDDYCDTQNGLCVHDTLPGCVNPCDTLTCFDDNLCTTDGCVNDACVFTAINCNDADACTTDSCDSQSGCFYTTSICDDNSLCTTDNCDSPTGCTFSPVICDDNNVCTINDCDSLIGCTFSPIVCDDNDLCTTDGCDLTTGCTFTPVKCDDNNICTDDYCDTLNGLCVYDTLPGCVNPCDTLTCVDNDLCTSDNCMNGACVFNPVDCNDGDACTTDDCDPQSGCSYTTLICNDGDQCTSDNCNTLTGCTFTPISCDDNNLCTNDGCDLFAGCTYIPLVCDDNDLCTTNGCDPLSGCFYSPVNCTDGNLCTTDACDPLTGCIFTAIICNDNDSCTVDVCVNGTCTYQTLCCITNGNCNDINPCTDDVCLNGNCAHTPVNCGDTDPCTVDVCVNGSCLHYPLNCVDGNPCTDDFCTNGVCQNVLKNCDDGNDCTRDFCQNGICKNILLSCVDGNPCTIDSCVNGVCINPLINCDDNDQCTTDFCQNGNCINRPINCVDGNLCTIDSCINGTCQYFPVNCDDGNECTNDFCQNGTCLHILGNCNDNDACTNDQCVNGACVNTPVNCNDGDPCTADSCISGQCTHQPINCDDSNSCTSDNCVNGQCIHTPIAVCNDNDPCTDDICLNGICTYSPVDCDDNNPCTVDSCVNGSCQHLDERRVLSFTLVDAATDLDIAPLLDSDTIYLSVTPSINVRANICATSGIESVKFMLNGSFFRMENILFYTIAGDNNGNYDPWNVTPGVYTIRAIPYSGDNGTGIVGIYHEITIVVVDGASPCGGDDRQVTDFTLVDADTDLDLGPLLNGDTIDLSVTPSISIRANVCLDENIESVKFLLNGSFHIMENILFYTIAGDNNGNYDPWNVAPGVYTVRAIPYSGNNGAGITGTYHEITIVIIDGALPCQANDISVTSFTLVSEATNSDIMPLADGTVIDLSLTGPVNVRANVFCEEHIESVKFRLNNNNTYRIENVAPYALAGDANGNYYTWNAQAGVYTIGATPYSGNNASGIAGAPLSITITIIGSAAKMSGEEQSLNEPAEDETTVLKAYPNPFRDKLTIEIKLQDDSPVKLDIYNIAGQKMATLFEGEVKSSELQQFEYTPEIASDGMIIYRLQTNNTTFYGKAVMVR